MDPICLKIHTSSFVDRVRNGNQNKNGAHPNSPPKMYKHNTSTKTDVGMSICVGGHLAELIIDDEGKTASMIHTPCCRTTHECGHVHNMAALTSFFLFSRNCVQRFSSAARSSRSQTVLNISLFSPKHRALTHPAQGRKPLTPAPQGNNTPQSTTPPCDHTMGYTSPNLIMSSNSEYERVTMA